MADPDDVEDVVMVDDPDTNPDDVDPVEPESDEPKHSGMMVAFIPSEFETESIAQPGGLPETELHMTLRYWPHGFTDDEKEACHVAAADIAANTQPFVAAVTGRRQLGEDTPPADVLICAVHPIMEFARGHLPPSDADYPSFTPHVTVGYGIGDDLLADAAVDNDIMFDAIAVCIGDDVTLYELGDLDEAPDDDRDLDIEDIPMLNEDGTQPDAVTAGIKGMIDGRVNGPSRRGGGNKLDPRPSGSKQKCYHGSKATCRSIRWIAAYSAMRDKGYSKRKAAMISNAMHRKWTLGIPNKIGQRPMVRKTL